MVIRNKWNGKEYKLIEACNGLVTLERTDGTQFTIKRAEYYENYIEIGDK
jgi:hypothetical protein